MESLENNERLVKRFESKKTLVNQKKKSNRINKKIRNIILNPTEHFWPALDHEEYIQFISAMARVTKFYLFEHEKSTKEWKKDLTIGLNETAAKKDVIWAVVLEQQVDPKFLIEHMVHLCACKGIIVLIVNSFRELIQELFGFPAIAVGFKKQSLTTLQKNEPSSPLYELCKLIKELGKAHEPPQSFHNFCKPVLELSKLKKPESAHVLVSQNTGKQKFGKSSSISNVYLSKPKSRRAFIPVPQNKGIQSQNVSEILEEKSKKRSVDDFISLSAGIIPHEEIEDEEEEDLQKGISYNILRARNSRPSSSTFIPLKYVEVQPKPKKKKIS